MYFLVGRDIPANDIVLGSNIPSQAVESFRDIPAHNSVMGGDIPAYPSVVCPRRLN